MYCIDTNILIDILRGDEKLASKLQNLSSSLIYITFITLCELYKGAYSYHDSVIKISDIKNLVSSFGFLNLNEKICEEFGKMYSELKKTGKMIEESDLFIASIVKVNNLILITRDKDFKKINIRTEIW
ncbi:type II toxin-antitoxin system VapC family toxin [Candidatus Pacearchaeota archaeon]|nr:type II toxin-antitoxin system VapC family toxin [Candidatus Pacearchaeota archaeon]